MPVARCIACVLPMALAAVAPAQHAEVRYGRDVRPILADRCFRCHGPDAGTREADLRLDLRDEALRARDGGAAIVPGNAQQSLLWQRVRHEDASERMPPRKSGKPDLTAAEVATIERWIEAGAPYESHWAFSVPVRPAVPATPFPASNPVDHFVHAQLAAAGRQPGPEADPETLVRRVFLVLTGLPPSPEEIDAFLADRREHAYEELVDKLLGEEPYRTRHAEHLAQPWLDASRYADTSGIHMDAGRQAWPWRDWLLEALRTDMPFDQFVIEQLAGDLLPGALQSQRVASGFLRQHVTTDEGGAIDEEYRIEYAAERTATLGSVFLGLTLGCARCHDHKYDPIRQEDYYRLFSFFNNNEEPGLYSQSEDSNRALEPFLDVPTPEQKAQRTQLRAELAAAKKLLDERTPADLEALEAFRAEFAADLGAAWSVPLVASATSQHDATLTVQHDGSVLASGTNPPRDVHVLVLHTQARDQRLLCLEAMVDETLPEGRVGRAPNGNAVLQHLQLEARPLDGSADFAAVPFVWAMADVEQDNGDYVVTNVIDDDDRGWAVDAHRKPPGPRRCLLLSATPFGCEGGTELRLTLRYTSQYEQHTFGRVRVHVGGLPEAMAARLPLATSGFHLVGPFEGDDAASLYATSFGPETVLAVDRKQRWGKQAWRFEAGLLTTKTTASLPEGRNATYVAQRLYNSSAREASVSLGSDDGFQLYLNGARQAERRVDRSLEADQDTATIQLPAGPSLLVLKVVNAGGDAGFALRHVTRERELSGDLRLMLLPPAVQDKTLLERAALAFRETTSPVHRARKAEVQRLTEANKALDAKIPRSMVMQESTEPRSTFVLMRGEYDKPDKGRPVARALPAVFGALPADAPPNRLGLAQWVVSADNPLFLRVAVNRLWEFVFGTGIVRTSEDFGLQGEWPSHPELLDWLATEFRARGHSTRAMLRLLVTSALFRQQSRVAPETGDRDNRLLGWFPRRRLTAEAIRDQALYVSGLLVERTGGPSVKPYQPPDLWQEVAMVQSNTRKYVQGTGEDLWRRSLYTYWKRACPPPSLLMLDAPTREFCTIRRSSTNTPLQALVLWNDEQFVEAARVLAERCLREHGRDASDESLLQSMYRRCTGHAMDDERLAVARRSLQAMRERYAMHPEHAKKLVETGQSPLDRHRPATELAALLVLAIAFLNLDACLFVD
ncbi:MAG TPA: PSD1 and planctomycete cytochrome C domain-containing protein [Planctomycetota bacterium]|nr:PSD1 and planctomycete cytochrome C domain-containing protein [Planctomycetota bacterium]